MTPPPPASDSTSEGTGYLLVALAWLSTRVIAVISVGLTPWMLNDLDIYQSWLPGLTEGVFPADDPTWQYPPGIAPLFLLAGSAPLDYRWAFTLAVLLVDAAVMAVLLWAHGRRPRSSWGGPWLWALAGLVVGSIMVVRFDVVPTLFAVVAVLLAARPLLSGTSVGLGLVTKAWPALMLLVLPRRSLPRGVLAMALTALVVTTAFALLTEGSLSFLANQQARGLQVESVGALPYVLSTLADSDVDFALQYGSIQVIAPGTEAVGLAVTLVGVALIVLLAGWRLAGRLEHVSPGDVALTVMLVSVATSRVYSPQFNVWLVGLAAVALLDRDTRMRAPVVLVVTVSLLTQVVYPWSATQLVTADPLTVVVQAARIVGLLAAAGLALVRVLRGPSDARTGGQLSEAPTALPPTPQPR